MIPQQLRENAKLVLLWPFTWNGLLEAKVYENKLFLEILERENSFAVKTKVQEFVHLLFS